MNEKLNCIDDVLKDGQNYKAISYLVDVERHIDGLEKDLDKYKSLYENEKDHTDTLLRIIDKVLGPKNPLQQLNNETGESKTLFEKCVDEAKSMFTSKKDGGNSEQL